MIVLPVGYRVVNKHLSEIDFINPKMINYFFFIKYAYLLMTEVNVVHLNRCILLPILNLVLKIRYKYRC